MDSKSIATVLLAIAVILTLFSMRMESRQQDELTKRVEVLEQQIICTHG